MHPSLADVPADKAFFCCTGARVTNLSGLANTVEHMEENAFNHHVTTDRNDFATWVHDVVKDEALFRLLRHEANKYWFAQKVRGHVHYLGGQ